jgi:hypothetical protein
MITAGGRVCKALFADPKARSKVRFGYTGAERMCLHGKWLIFLKKRIILHALPLSGKIHGFKEAKDEKTSFLRFCNSCCGFIRGLLRR